LFIDTTDKPISTAMNIEHFSSISTINLSR